MKDPAHRSLDLGYFALRPGQHVRNRLGFDVEEDDAFMDAPVMYRIHAQRQRNG